MIQSGVMGQASPILTTTVGSYPVPDWLAARPSEQARVDATRVVLDIQRQAGIDLPTDGELYRFDLNHPDTNGMIEYFIRPLSGVRSQVGRSDWRHSPAQSHMGFRRKPAGVVEGPIGEGSLNLLGRLRAGRFGRRRAVQVHGHQPLHAGAHLLDRHYADFDELTMAIADRPRGAGGRPARATACRSTRPTFPATRTTRHWPPTPSIAVLDRVEGAAAVHLCFGNYGGQTIQQGAWRRARRLPQRSARRSRGAGNGAPPGRRICTR